MDNVIFKPLCLICGFLFFLSPEALPAQNKRYYWQQQIAYDMDIDLDVQTHQYKGRQVIKYKNNSPEVLDKVFFHLYLNAFQPGSAMDVRSRTIPDPDPRIGERILNLKENEIGYQKVRKLTQNGIPLQFETIGTILEVKLAKPLRPGQTTKFEMNYDAQVPIQIRRNGRDNKEGIRYSMSQWYPKMCEYDRDGWHAHPYIGREFYGVWGDFNFTLTIDSDYTVAASGVLQNPREIGHGYAPEPSAKKDKLTWHFIAENVHDFAWAADPDYQHEVFQTKAGVTIHTFHQEEGEYAENWKKLPAIIDESIQYINQHFGKYPYPTYSFIQGGDGGMEYPMATLITGKRPLGSLVGVSIHELLHSWFQMVLGFNESYYYWMDEGFTDYAETRVINHLKEKGLLSGTPGGFLYEGTYKNYKNLVEQGIEEPLTTHADHFDYNSAYSIAAYVKGAVFLNQLEYVIGQPAFNKGMLDFFNQWKFKHPDDRSLIRTMEKTSGLELDWYRDYMVNSTKIVDYGIDTVVSQGASTTVTLFRAGGMPMPVDLSVVLKNGTQIVYSIPLDIMRGAKSEKPDNDTQLTILADWNWVNPEYYVTMPYRMDQIESISIDPTRRLADMDESNNRWSPITP